MNASRSCPTGGSAQSGDVTRRPLGLLLWYGLPIAAIFAAGHLLADARAIGLVWAGVHVRST